MPAGILSSRRWLFISVAILLLCLALACTAITLAWQQTERTEFLQSEALRREAVETARQVHDEVGERIGEILMNLALMPSVTTDAPPFPQHPWIERAFVTDATDTHFIPRIPPAVEPSPPLDEAPIWMLEARQLEIAQRQPRQAIALYERCLSPATPPVWQRQARLAIARCHQKLDEPENALEIYEKLLEERAPTADRLTPALALLDTLAAINRKSTRDNMVDRLVREARTGSLRFPENADIERFLARLEPADANADLQELAAELRRQRAARQAQWQFRDAARALVSGLAVAGASSPGNAVQFYRENSDESALLIAYGRVNGSSALPIAGIQIDAAVFTDAFIRPAMARLSPPDLRLIEPEAPAPELTSQWSIPMSDAFPNVALVPAEAFTARMNASTWRQRAIYVVLTVAILGTVVIALLLSLRAIRRDLEYARLQSEFIAGVSHELKTPLALIRMYGETLNEGKVSDDAKRSHYHAVIARESERLTRMIDALLDFSAVRLDGKGYDLESVNPETILHDVIECQEEYLKQQGFTLDTRIQPDLPTIRADTTAVIQALGNLIDNAVKYSPDHKEIAIAAHVSADRRHVTIEVSDRGLGIAFADQKRLFEPFFRAADERVRRTRGNGLGLALVKHMADAHGAPVTIESRPGQGTTVRIDFPAAGQPERTAATAN